MVEDELNPQKVAYLEDKGFNYLNNKNVWVCKYGAMSRKYLINHKLNEVKGDIDKAINDYGKIEAPIFFYLFNDDAVKTIRKIISNYQKH